MLNGASANTDDGAWLDIAANGFWGGKFERAYFDVRVFNPEGSEVLPDVAGHIQLGDSGGLDPLQTT